MKSTRLYFYNFISRFIPETSFFKFKVFLLRFCGVDISYNARICSSVKFLGNGSIKISSGVWIGPYCKLICAGDTEIDIQENVDIGPDSILCTGSHEVLTYSNRIAGRGCSKSIIIGKGSWICMRSVIVSGVSIGEMCLIAANSTVISSTDCYGLYAGNPTKRVREIICQ